MATYQLSNLISEVQRKAKDPSFSSALITDYLNDTQDDVLAGKVWPFQDAALTGTLGTGSHTYDADDDFQSLLGLSLTDPTNDATARPDYIPHRQFFDRNAAPDSATAGEPSEFTVFAGQVVFDRPADKSYTLNLRYLMRPTKLENAADVPTIPEEFKQVLVRGALAGVEEYRDNYDIAAVHRRKLEDLVENMNLRLGSRQLIRTAKATTSRGAHREI